MTADANVNATVSLELTASTIKTLELRDGTNPEGTFNLGLKAVQDGTQLITAVADKKLNVLVEPRFDQRIVEPLSSPNTTTVDGTEYIGISARSGLPAYPRDERHSPVPGKGIPNGRILPIDPETISRYTLVMPDGAPFKAEDVLVSYNGSEWKKAKVDANGNPYVDGKYDKSNPQFRFLIPTEGLPGGKTDFTTRMDIVDKQGNPTRIKDSRGVPSNIPSTAGNQALGNNVADPGGISECSASTADEKQGLLAGEYGFPNNNCAKQTVDLTRWKCSLPGGCPSAKDDIGVNWVETEDEGKPAFGGKQALTTANVRIDVTPVDVKDNPTICAAWQPGTQRVVTPPSNVYVPTVQVGGDGRNDIHDAYPNAKVYITKEDKTNGGKPDCAGDEGWEVFYDADAGVKGNTFAEPGSMKPNEIAGIKIVIPGKNVIQRPTIFRYVATAGDPRVVSTLPTVKAKKNDVEYYKTINYAATYQGNEKRRDMQDVILAEKPAAGVRDIWGTLGEVPLGGIGEQKQTLITAGQVVVNNGTLAAVNSKDADGNPTRVHMRIYLSKCVTADEESLSPGMTYHRGEISTNPNDCAPSEDNYIERTWALSDQKNETGDPKNDPFFPIDWATKNADKSTVFFQPWDNGQPKPKFTVVTPAWSGPKQTFDVVHSYRITGTPELDLDKAMPALKKDKTIKSSSSQDAFTPAKDNAKEYFPLNSMAALSTLTVPNVLAAGLSKSTDDKLVPGNTPFQHSLELKNLTEAQLGTTQFIDVLPFNGDWRETKFNGEYWLSKVPEKLGSNTFDGQQIYYTYDDPKTVSVCPTNAKGKDDLDACVNAAKATKRDIDKKPSNTTWAPLTQEVIDAQAKPGAKHITALRFESPLLSQQSNDKYVLDFQPHGNKHGDKYVNSTGVATMHAVRGDSADATGLGALPVPQPDPVKTEVYAASISGTVYQDVNRDEKQQDNEKKLPGYTVTLYEVDENGEIKKGENGEPVVSQTATSDSNGNYSFEAVKPGKYRVVVSPLKETDINTEAGKGTAGSWNGEVIDVTAPTPENYDPSKPQVHPDYDFGVYQAEPKITLKKTVNGKESDQLALGAEAKFVLAGENNGNVDLEQVKLVDAWVEGKEPLDLTCSITPKAGGEYAGNATEDLLGGTAKLAVGDTYECSGTYTVSQEDIDNQAEMPNDANVEGKYPYTSATTGEPKEELVKADSKATVTVPEAKPALDVTKTVDGQKSVEKKAGETAAWKIVGRNTGDVTLHNVKLVDQWTGGDIELTCKIGEDVVDVLAGNVTLPVGAEFTCVGESEITQDQVDAGDALPNKVTLTGSSKPEGGEELKSEDTATVTVPKAEPKLVLEKSVTNWVENENEPLLAGDTIEYKFIVTNNGNVTVQDVKVEDPKVDNLNCGDSNMTLAPGASLECTASHVLTEEDVKDKTEYVNTAKAKGVTPGKPGKPGEPDKPGTPVESNEDEAKVKLGTPKLDVTKTVDGQKSVEKKAGETAAWKIVGRNTGDVTLHNVKLVDQWTGGDIELTCKIGEDVVDVLAGNVTLPVGAEFTCVGESEITQDQVDAGDALPNKVTLTGSSKPEGGEELKSADTATVTVPDAKPALELVKTVDGQKSVLKKAGEKAEWKITGKNTGNVTLYLLQLTDEWTGGDIDLTCTMDGEEIDVLGGKGTLPVGAEFTCTGESVITQEQVDAGKELPNNVTLTGTSKPEGGQKVSAKDTATVTVPKTEPSLSLQKTVTNWSEDAEPLTVGDTIEYKFIVSNNGNVTVKDVKVEDPQVDNLDCGDSSTTLAPGESLECTASHVLTDEDVKDKTEYVNTAKATGSTTPGDPVESNEDEAKVKLGTPKLELKKAVQDKKDSYKVGEKVTYVFTVTNTGKLTLSNIKVDDEMLKEANVDVTCEETTLAPGASTTCTSGEYTVTEADGVAGEVVNTAEATASTPTGKQVKSNEDKAKIKVEKPSKPKPPTPGSPNDPTPGSPNQPGGPTPGEPGQPPQVNAPEAGEPGKPQAQGGEKSSLARTGASVIGAVLAGLALVAVGGMLVFGSRRRRN